MNIVKKGRYLQSFLSRGFVVGLCLAFLALMAVPNMYAGILTLEPALSQTLGPQSMSIPCIISGTNCQNPDGFDWGEYKNNGNVSEYEVYSPVYDMDDFAFSTFDIAIDVNTADRGEVLEYFGVVGINEEGETTLYSYNGGGNIGDLSSNGSGFADWILKSVNLSDYREEYPEIQFTAKWSGNSGGAESFFLIDTENSNPGFTAGTGEIAPVPEAGTVLLLGMGLAALSILVFRKKKHKI